MGFAGEFFSVNSTVTQFVWVRALFFDQPRDRTWASAWHKDISISVKDNSIASGGAAAQMRAFCSITSQCFQLAWRWRVQNPARNLVFKYQDGREYHRAN